MARTTTNYGFNISEGSDLVNPLTDIFPNFESLDGDLKEVSDATFGVATELKTGTVHALTRDDKDKTVFKFTATANFTAGDTFTLDGAQVSALTTAGEQLTTGCYIIGSEVIVAVKGTLLTFFISNVVTDASTLEGHDASYFATASGLSDTDADVLAVSNKVGSAVLTTTAQDCSGAINELHSDISNISTLDFDLLWTNPNGGASFSAQTVQIANLSQYNFILFDVQYGPDGSSAQNLFSTTTVRYEDGKGTNLGMIGSAGTRGLTFNGDSIIFSSGSDSGKCVPRRIYGIKARV